MAPVLSTNSSATRLTGTFPVANADYPFAIVDLYQVDPVGRTNGLAAKIAALPRGFVQGFRHLGSFVESSVDDLNPTPGAFEFDLAGVDFEGASNLTVTVTYSRSTPGTHNAAGITSPFAEPVEISLPPGGGPAQPIHIMTISAANNLVQIAWTGGAAPFTVQRKTSFANDWENAATTAASRKANLPVDSAAGFFRIAGH